MNANDTKRIPVRLLKKGNPNSTIFILGATGSGKSTLVGNLLFEEERFVVFDTRDEYYPAFFDNDKVISVDTLLNFQNALNDVNPRIIFKVESDDQFEAALRSLYEFQKLNSIELPPIRVSIDELNRFCDTSCCPESLREIIQRGRDYKINKLLGAQWFGTLPTWVRDSFSEIYTFRHNDPRGLALLEIYGFNKQQIRELPQYFALHNSKTGVERIELKASDEK